MATFSSGAQFLEHGLIDPILRFGKALEVESICTIG
jgi:hypothetical protein